MPVEAMKLVEVGQTLLAVRGASKRYGETRALHQVDLEVPRGSIYGILGPNGAGKTTAIRSVMGIIIPDAGEIRFAGRPPDRQLRDRIGYLPEERGLYRKMKCREQLAYLADVSLGEPTYISEGSISSPVTRDYYYEAGGMVPVPAPAPTTSISPGETEIRLNVQVVYSIK